MRFERLKGVLKNSFIVTPSAEFGFFVVYDADDNTSVVDSFRIKGKPDFDYSELNSDPEKVTERFEISESGVITPIDSEVQISAGSLGATATQVACFIEAIPATPKLQQYL